MAVPTVAAFTDTYLPTVNGVTYTVSTWRERWGSRGGRMHVVYPDAADHQPASTEHPVRSVAFPYYEGFRVGVPGVPTAVERDDVDIVHAHTPFLLGLGGARFARNESLPLVASYHTPTAEYADYITDGRLADAVERVARRYERWYLDRTDTVVVPSEPAREHLTDIGVSARIEVVPNGVDVDRFRPVDTDAFRTRHDLDDGYLLGYTGRHGYEKDLDVILDAVDGFRIDGERPTVVFGGDGPARQGLMARAETIDADVRFLGFLDREELAAFYTSLDAFLFPSPVETQGLVALEANACGTPVVGVDSGALAETVDEGETGFHFEPGDVDSFREAIRWTIADRDTLSRTCLDRRDAISVEHAVDTLDELYRDTLDRH
ncbi:glycosyltransferase [Haloglomus halophilum]|uniref:glycosyltransferase n=1 Tax=Haloglomus halophilum TaxID=2962672 RepID=UPI0020C9ABDE|nr:glycosyltransferase [Haloglomus halophilum]